MSLAALAGYASSNESDDESNEAQQSSPKVAARSATLSGVDSIVDDDDEYPAVSAGSSRETPSHAPFLFSSLPAPKVSDETPDLEPEEDKVEPVPKSTKRQIVIPKLSELDDKDDDEPKAKKKVFKSLAGSGLLKMLPPPATVPIAKGSQTTLTQLTPHSLGKKPPPPKPKLKPKIIAPTPATNLPEEEDNDGGPSNFFSFDEPKLSDEQLKNLITAEDLKPREKRPPSPDVGPVFAVAEPEPEPLPAVSAPGSQEIPAEALAQLRGRRQEKVEIFSIDAAEFAAEARSNLSKNLTVEDSRPPRGEGPEPSRLHKSKHHITHLAFQAKARENELKNQWATNRMTKRETQKKYGF